MTSLFHTMLNIPDAQSVFTYESHWNFDADLSARETIYYNGNIYSACIAYKKSTVTFPPDNGAIIIKGSIRESALGLTKYIVKIMERRKQIEYRVQDLKVTNVGAVYCGIPTYRSQALIKEFNRIWKTVQLLQ